jgi:tRNA(Ile)-lysidine synthase
VKDSIFPAVLQPLWRNITDMSDIFDQVSEFIRKKEMIQKGNSILLSLSAGKDSMALLDIMLRMKDVMSLRLGIFHLNHGMRGKESDKDEKFVAGLAKKNGLDIFIEKYDFKNNLEKGSSFEEQARAKRYELLDGIRNGNDFDFIATAHNSDDVVETVLMRIFTGTGIFGLTGIRAVRDRIIRPVLNVSADEIYEYLNEREISWREDASNKDETYLRNYVRHSVLPAVTEKFSSARNAILNLSALSGDAVGLIDELIFAKYGDIFDVRGSDKIVIRVSDIPRSRKLMMHLLSRAFRELNLFVNTDILKEIFRNLQTSKTNSTLYSIDDLTVKKNLLNGEKCIVFQIGTDKPVTVQTDENIFWEYKIKASIPVEELRLTEIDRVIKSRLVDYESISEDLKSKKAVFIELDENVEYITIRNRRAGDRIKLNGFDKKIKDIFIEKKLENINKNSIPLIIAGSDVAAIAFGFVMDSMNRVSDRHMVRELSKKILAIYIV